jgi:hypothetical protein
MAEMTSIVSSKVLPKEPKGNDDPEQIFASVGRALTQWESLQLALAYLFIEAIGATFKFPVMRAFGHSMLVTSKLDMIEYAAEASLHFHNELHSRVKQFVKSVRGYNDRRNDIAHGQVMRTQEGYYLMPALSTSKKYAAFSGVMPAPAYCWTSAQINRYCAAFAKLEDDCAPLRQEVQAITGQYAALEADKHL